MVDKTHACTAAAATLVLVRWQCTSSDSSAEIYNQTRGTDTA